ncbi:MAG: hypothetical protein N2256_09695 [Tepidimonas ignava]|uniref:hypothetical protein n=1 Tax=Tepidimonas ignava TaxID=114249 RepID=UPI002A2D34AC|nr:hypothetical protein [Tepidimonas ignava]
MSNALPYVTGSARTGLTGPYAFAPQWTFQRRGALQKTSRRRARHLQRFEGQELRGAPLYVEAVTPPLKVIRRLLTQLAEVVQIHQRYDIGFDALNAYFPGPDGDAWIDFADGTAIEACPRAGTRGFFSHWRRWFGWWYAELQKRALANGRYFPPPVVLRVRTPREGTIRVEMGFAPGFLPGDRLYVLAIRLDGRGGVPYLLGLDEPLPAQAGVRAVLREAAERWRHPEETVAVIGSVFSRDLEALCALREGDALEVLGDADRWRLVVARQGRPIGYVWEGEHTLRQLRDADEALRLRVIRLHYVRHDQGGRIAFAAYRASAS